MSQIDSVGTYRGTIAESGIATTKTGKPQWVARFKATEKYITEPAELAHFKLTEPGWVDWSSFGEDIVAFLLLFNSADVFDANTVMLNYEQLIAATGWDGQSFDALGNFVGSRLLFRVGEKKPYTDDQGKVRGEGQLEVSWVDAYDAAPERALKTLAGDDIKALNAKLKMARPKPAAAPAKPAAAKPAAAPAPAPAPAPAAPAPAPAAPPKSRKKAAPAAPAPVTTDLPGETDQVGAWEYLITHKGAKDDSAAEQAWIDACGEVGGDRTDDDFTPKDWAKVRDIALTKLAA